MSKYLVQDTELTSIADAIRAKGGTSEQLAFPNGFVSAVEGIRAGGSSLKRTAHYRPSDMPDYSSLNLSENEAYAFFTYDTELPMDESLRKATFGWYFYNIGGHNYYVANVDRGHIENGAFVVDERILENQYYANDKSVDITLPRDAGRFVSYRISSNDPTWDVNKVRVKLFNFTDEYGNLLNYNVTPCVETFLWNCGGEHSTTFTRSEYLTTRNTKFYTAKGCAMEGGTGEFWNAGARAPEVIVWDNIVFTSNFGYLPFSGLGDKCSELYITNSKLTMGSYAQNQFQNASGLRILDFSGSTITATGMSNCFSGCSSLRRLDLSGWIMTGVTNLANAFSNMTSLVELILPEMPTLSFSLDKSTLLTVASLNQIISVLPQLEEGVSCTLTLGATNTAKLTEDEIAVATGKGWAVA